MDVYLMKFILLCIYAPFPYPYEGNGAPPSSIANGEWSER
jgi:hypothetical protein